MLTSRNEFRLLHRQDNANERLMSVGHEWGTISDADYERHRRSDERVQREVARLGEARHRGDAATTMLCRPGVDYQQVVALVGPAADPLTADEVGKVETLVRYASYIERSRRQLEGRAAYERMSLAKVDFDQVASLSHEGAQALKRAAPSSLGAAQRLRGVRDSDVTALLVHLKGRSTRGSLAVGEKQAATALGGD